jgi:hypothetical protein
MGREIINKKLAPLIDRGIATWFEIQGGTLIFENGSFAYALSKLPLKTACRNWFQHSWKANVSLQGVRSTVCFQLGKRTDFNQRII